MIARDSNQIGLQVMVRIYQSVLALAAAWQAYVVPLGTANDPNPDRVRPLGSIQDILRAETSMGLPSRAVKKSLRDAKVDARSCCQILDNAHPISEDLGSYPVPANCQDPFLRRF